MHVLRCSHTTHASDVTHPTIIMCEMTERTKVTNGAPGPPCLKATATLMFIKHCLMSPFCQIEIS